MGSRHLNERGTHTTVIEAAQEVLSFFKKNKQIDPVQVSPGKIEGGIGAKGSSLKFKHINNEVYEMVITHNSSRQEFKIFTTTPATTLCKAITSDKKLKNWNLNYTDMRGVHKSSD